MADFSSQIQVQMQSYQDRIEILEKALGIWKSLQVAILEQGIKLVGENGLTLSYDGVCYFTVTDADGRELYEGSRWDDAFRAMGVAL